MAFGKPTDVKRIKNAVLEDQLTKSHVITEERTSQNWKKKWNWLLEEYVGLEKKIRDLSNDSEFLRDVNKGMREKDKRVIRPIPVTTNHEYGWIPNLPNFQLEKYGPDYDPGAPLPPSFKIFKEFEYY